MRRILIGVILLILYGSLYPWQFVRAPPGEVLAWPDTFDSADVILNILVYVPLGACAYWAFPALRRMRFVLPILLGLVLSFGIELVQAFEPARSSELSDVLANTGGAAIGMLLAAFIPMRPSPELYLLACWAAHLVFFGAFSWPVEMDGWLVALSAAMPGRSFRWRGIIAVMCYLALLYRGLAPFHFVSTPAPFNWRPFEAFIFENREDAIRILMAKLFWYGAAVWVLRRLRLGWIAAGAVAASVLMAIEITQRYIPPHISEITDPLMALLIAAFFAALPRIVMVVAGVIRRDGRILICQRKRGGRHELKWEFPGGKVEEQETPPNALARELREELGVEARVGKEITRYEYQYPSRPPILLIFYEVTDFSGESENRIFEQMVWEEPARLPSYDFLEGDERFLLMMSARVGSPPQATGLPHDRA
jgi:mutator protein MutT